MLRTPRNDSLLSNPVSQNEESIDIETLQHETENTHTALIDLKRKMGLFRLAQRVHNPDIHRSSHLIKLARSAPLEAKEKIQKGFDETRAKIQACQEKISNYHRLFCALGSAEARSAAVGERLAGIPIPAVLIDCINAYDRASAYDETFYTRSAIDYTFLTSTTVKPSEGSASTAGNTAPIHGAKVS